VFLTTTGLIKLGDFGFSREYDSTVSGDVGSTFCGTPYYLAPELWNQAPYSKKADMWSLGIVLYELMALRKPFSGGSMRELVSNVMLGRFDPLPENYTPELRQLCLDLLHSDPRQRPSIDNVFHRDVLRVNGLQVLQRNVPRLTSVPETTRQALVADVEQVLLQQAMPDDE
jgi:serine/threonine protein kinase